MICLTIVVFEVETIDDLNNFNVAVCGVGLSLLSKDLSEHVMAEPAGKPNEIVAPQLISGKPPPPQQLILLYSANDWEEFLREWGHYQKKQYHLVTRLGGANDYGVDVACFCTDDGFQGDWDNYQCKHYADPLGPKTAIQEIGKLMWHVYSNNLTKPRKYYFFAPKDCGPSLKKLLLDKGKLRLEVKSKWSDWCAKSITSTQDISLDGEFGDFVENFDFSIFNYKPSLEIIEEHQNTPYHTYRFFKTLEGRPAPEKPPTEHAVMEAKYIEKLLDAYSDYSKLPNDQINLSDGSVLARHFLRQRENFYYAEALKLFSRDSVPPGTYDLLQDEMFSAVVEVVDDIHDNGFECVKAVTKHAQGLGFPSNVLHQVMKVQDKQGICHQLANDDKLSWVKKDE